MNRIRIRAYVLFTALAAWGSLWPREISVPPEGQQARCEALRYLLDREGAFGEDGGVVAVVLCVSTARVSPGPWRGGKDGFSRC